MLVTELVWHPSDGLETPTYSRSALLIAGLAQNKHWSK